MTSFFLQIVLLFFVLKSHFILGTGNKKCFDYDSYCICETDQYDFSEYNGRTCKFLQIKETSKKSLKETLNSLPKDYLQNFHRNYGYQRIYSLEISRGATEILNSHTVSEYLKVLRIENTKISIISSLSLASYKNLFYLDLTNNQISQIDDSSFQTLHQLKVLRLNFNNITNISENTFSGMSNLESLHLSNNQIQKLHDSVFNLLKLNFLDLSHNEISEIDGAPFKYLPNLRELRLKNTKISAINHQMFDGLDALAILNMQGSNLHAIALNTFPVMLQTLTVTVNNMSVFSTKLENLNNLVELNFEAPSQNSQVLKTNMFRGLTKFVNLDLNNMNISAIEPYAFRGLNGLKEFNLANNFLESFDKNTFAGLFALREMDLSHNLLRCQRSAEEKPLGNASAMDQCSSVFDALNHMVSIETIYLNDNSIDSLGENSFSMLSKLNFIDLSDNMISSIDSKAFAFLPTLKTLILTNNNISSIPVGVFKSLSSLDQLHLSHNQISTLGFGIFTDLKLLKFLDLSYNNISQLNEKIFISLETLDDFNFAHNQIKNVNITALNRYLPRLSKVHLESNNIDCSKLTNIVEMAKNLRIELINASPEFDSDNVNGILCSSEENDDNALLQSDKLMDILAYLKKNFNLTNIS